MTGLFPRHPASASEHHEPLVGIADYSQEWEDVAAVAVMLDEHAPVAMIADAHIGLAALVTMRAHGGWLWATFRPRASRHTM